MHVEKQWWVGTVLSTWFKGNIKNQYTQWIISTASLLVIGGMLFNWK